MRETVVNYRTDLTLDVQLGNKKFFSTADTLLINMGGGTYLPSDPSNIQPVYCEVIDSTTKNLLPEFSSCKVSDLQSILITVSINTQYDKFTVRILNYIVKATGTGVPIPTGEVYFTPNSATKI